MKKTFTNWIKIIIFLTPFFTGVYGLYAVEKVGLNNALFYSFSMYFIGYGEKVSNCYVEIARWTAPVMTASTTIFLVNTIRYYLENQIKRIHGDCVAVYGQNEESAILLKQLGKRGIEGKEEFVDAQQYILVGRESENLSFYQKYSLQLRGKTVYLKCSSLESQSIRDKNVKLFCPEETAARIYWKKYCMYSYAFEKNFKIKIVFIGFDKLGEELLDWGLLDNIFHPDQKIEYHIFGEALDYKSLHHQLSQISDRIVFHEKSWWEELSFLESTDKIILCDQKHQLETIKKLLFALKEKKIDVFVDDSVGIELLEEQERLNLFFWKIESQKIENLFEERLLDVAKRINLRYAHIYNGVDETEINKELEWNKLDSFTKYSNISVADYHEIQLEMISVSGNKFCSQSDMYEILAELEHIRWCRYHYLNNWKYGIPEDGKNKDNIKKIHCDLKPYKQLPEKVKEKDRENVQLLVSIAKEK